jgi:hypothetical protein
VVTFTPRSDHFRCLFALGNQVRPRLARGDDGERRGVQSLRADLRQRGLDPTRNRSGCGRVDAGHFGQFRDAIQPTIEEHNPLPHKGFSALARFTRPRRCPGSNLPPSACWVAYRLVTASQHPGRRGTKAEKKLAHQLGSFTSQLQRLRGKKVAAQLDDTLVAFAHGAQAAMP